ncbi:MAG: hypothetical protein AAFX87_04465 [Bacteroidota bacterium]
MTNSIGFIIYRLSMPSIDQSIISSPHHPTKPVILEESYWQMTNTDLIR